MSETPSTPEAGGAAAEPAPGSSGTAATPAAVQSPSSAGGMGGKVLKGTSVAPGLVLGQVHRKDYDILRASLQRVPLDQVERELNRFHRALSAARSQLSDLKQRLSGKVPADDARILDVHVAYLKDSVFISDVENLILNEQMSLEAAIGKVISDFDRIFRLVQNETLRERAVDLRDVGIRVLRYLETMSDEPGVERKVPPDYVLVARELSIVDMFNLSGNHVLGILTESGGLTSHAAILARSMRIPTITGVEKLLESVNEGDLVIVDASEGIVRVNPDEVVVAQYRQASSAPVPAPTSEVSAWTARTPRTQDGETVHVAASCGNLPEVDQALAYGMNAIGLYRTELLYLVDKEQPSRETLAKHYASVVEQARGATVTFRLLQADSSLEIGYLHTKREQNPALGRTGVRALLAREAVLRRQLQAILLGATGGRARIAIPFVTDCGELRRVKEVLFEERLELRKNKEPHLERCEIGVVIETPASLLGARDLAQEADFLLLSLDAVQQHLLATDRENSELHATFESLHPYVLRALRKLVEVADEAGKPLSVFGVSAVGPQNVPFLLGVGLREFCVSPVFLREFVSEVARTNLKSARRAAETSARATCQAETLSLVESYRHGYVRR